MTTAAVPSLICFIALAQRMRLIVGGLQRAVAARGGRDRAMAPTVVLVWKRLNRLAARFEALVARLKAGRAVAPRSPAVRRTRAAGAEAAAEAPAETLRLPGGFGWLVRLLPETRDYGGQVQALCADPEIAALLAADPRAGRILRPFLRMMAIRPEAALALPPVRRKRAPPVAAPETAGPETPGPQTPGPQTPGSKPPGSKMPRRRVRGARPASGTAKDEPSVISQVWAALLRQTAGGITPVETPRSRPRKPPWGIMGR